MSGKQGRVPPQDVDAERSVLGAMMLEVVAIAEVVAALAPDDFYLPAHAFIYEAMTDLFQANQPVDEITVSGRLRAAGRLDAVGGTAYLAALTESVPTAANVSYYADIVKNRSLTRRLISVATAIAG